MRPIGLDVKRPCWHIRLSDPSEEVISRCEYMVCDSCVVGLEVGTKTERQHIQSVWYWKSQKTKKQILKMFKPEDGKSYYIEPMIAAWDKNATYCSKESEIRREGEGPQQGERNDLTTLKRHIDEGGSLEECYDINYSSMVRYGKGIKEYYDTKRRKVHRTEMTRGYWLWGPTGVGKSHRAFKDYDESTHYIKSVSEGDVKWWDGYVGQETVIINEFRGQIPYAELLDIIDKWPKVLSRRGREPCQLLAKRVIITSCMPPEKVYRKQEQKDDSIEQLLRRLEVYNIDSKNSHPLLELK